MKIKRKWDIAKITVAARGSMKKKMIAARRQHNTIIAV